MNKIQEMNSFVAVADAGSFVRAAEAVGLSKAAVSRHVSELEKRLGVRLFHRTTRSLSLTIEGKLFLERCKKLLVAVDQAEEELTSQLLDSAGTIRINTPLSFGISRLAPMWSRYNTLYPKVLLDVTLNDQTVNIVDEGYDLAIRISPPLKDSSLVSRKLGSSHMVLCCTPEYIQRYAAPLHPSELATHQTISYSYWPTGDDWHFTGPEGSFSVRINPCMRANNGDTCRAAALEHRGIILQPDFIVDADLRRGNLVKLLSEYQAPDAGIFAVYPSQKHLPLRVRKLVDFLVAEFDETK